LQHPGAPQGGYPGAPQGGYPGAPQAAPAAGPTIEQRLERLADLKNKGLITDEEFQARKAKILEEI
jgi:hypothetical protein